LISDRDRGGLPGFLDRLRRGGLGDQVASWIGTGSSASLTPEQLEGALGSDTVQRVSADAGVPATTGRSALAYLVPSVVDLLTPGGTVPAGLPAGRGGLETRAATATAADGSGRRNLVTALLVLLLAFLGYRYLGRRGPVEPTGMASDTTAMAPAEPAAGPGEANADVAGAMKKSSEALAALQPGYRAKELVDALNLNIINFAPGKAEIPAESRAILDQSAKAIAGAPAGTVLQVGGHTDNTGSAAGNQALSTRRAAAVRDYLVQHGVRPPMLTAKGFGSSEPVADNSTGAGRFKNRRIAFTVVK